MTVDNAAASTIAPQSNPNKRSRLPDNVKVHKRPLLHPAIPSPYNGKWQQKVVYVSAKMPFMSAVKKVQKLFKEVDKRTSQSATSRARHGKKTPHNHMAAAIKAQEQGEHEEILLKGTGRAIEQTLQLALYFQQQREYRVQLRTGTVTAIDDIELPPRKSRKLGPAPLEMVEKDGEMGYSEDTGKLEFDTPETQVRHISLLEVTISLR
ncbi:hypothetical protein M501DRAFT_992109 [Patellaria atrata CBS 101060]|uniref:Uncharacterized protein n=1 Tax=Patellaria atrata CBS 101060 TaxID=1346257 RepID=A0A9P4SC80_9PEZI|nr:hypothetical protein M501DRAFT_992109 [Patellaria atrata CBS 101060]